MKLNKMPLITVVIPCFNLEKVIGKCIESIINQSYKNIEVFIINDGSNDSSRTVVEAYCNTDARIILINQENQGVGAAYNKGLRLARGEYVYILDGDNYVDNCLLERLYIQITKDNSDVVCCGYYLEEYCHDKYRSLGQLCYSNSLLKNREQITKDIFNVYKAYIWQSPCNKLYRSNLLQDLYFEVDRKFMMIVDSEFNIRLLDRINRISIIDEPMVHYIQYNTLFRKQITAMWKDRYVPNSVDCEERLYKAIYKFYNKNKASNNSIIEIKNYFFCRYIRILSVLLLDDKLFFKNKKKELNRIRCRILDIVTRNDIISIINRSLFDLVFYKKWMLLKYIFKIIVNIKYILPGVFKFLTKRCFYG